MHGSKSLEEQRKEIENRERANASMLGRVLQYQRERYALAEAQLFFMTEQYLTDQFFINENVLTWLSKAKPESEQLKVLQSMAAALVRMDAYTKSVQTAAEKATEITIRDHDIISGLESDLRKKDLEIMKLEQEPKKLLKEIERLKQQLAFHEQK